MPVKVPHDGGAQAARGGGSGHGTLEFSRKSEYIRLQR